jgi:PAS domain
MAHFEAFDPEIHTHSDRICDLFRVWDEIRGDRLLPGRSDFDPMKIPELLPYIFMDDVFYDPLRFRFRLVGTEIARGLGFDPTGEFRDAKGAFTDSWNRLCQTVEARTPVIGLNLVYRSPEKYFEDYTCIHLPFSADGERVNIIMSLSDIRRTG